MVHKTLKQRFYPTEEQKILLAQTFGCVRVVYNRILDMRTKSYQEDGVKVGYTDASKMLTSLKKDSNFPWLNDVSSVALQQSIRNQQSAFKNFFEKRAKYPKFRKKNNKQSAEFTRAGFKWDGETLTLAKMKEPLDIHWSYDKPEDISSITIVKDCANRYFVCMRIEFEPNQHQPSDKMVGVDLGLKDRLIYSDGEKEPAISFTKKYARKLKIAQRVLARKKKGSNNRNKARLRVARLQAKLSDSRSDYINKLTSTLVKKNQLISMEDLNVKGMVKNHCLAKSISDASWGEIVRQIKYKAEWYGREFIQIGRFFPSSKLCGSCGYIHDLKLSDRKWTCPKCNTTHDRDLNAAQNILRQGMSLFKACGLSESGVVA